MYDLYKTPERLIGQVLLVVFLLVVLGTQVVSAQDLPPCTESLSELPEYQDDGDGVEQAVDIDKDGDGLIEICDLEGLYEMRYVLDGSGYSTSPTTTPIRTGCSPTCTGFELTRNLDFNIDASYRTTASKVSYTVASPDDDADTGWEPIGTSADNFRARFEGNGHTISNLMINRDGSANSDDRNTIGLFGVAGAGANITHIGLLNVHIEGRNRVGGLIGLNNSFTTQSHVYVTGSVEGSFDVGGLVGGSSGPITNSYATGSVEGNNDVGGLVGGSSGPITNSYATGSVEGNNDVGGLVGRNVAGSITNSYAANSVLGIGRVGGLVGFNIGPITNSYATGSVEGNNDVGGLVGFNIGPITNSYATGSVEGNDAVGGLVGGNDGSITSSYATGSASGNYQVGGLVGWNRRTIRNSYATGDVSGIGDSPTNLGGLVGFNIGPITNSYATGFGILVGSVVFADRIINSSTQTVMALKKPTAARGIYSGWSSAVWDFGTDNDLPTLRDPQRIEGIQIHVKVFLEGLLQ